jgi:hypothetical protein
LRQHYGALTLQTKLFDLGSLNINMSMLNTAGFGFTRKERKNSAEPISELDGPTIDTSCHRICISCKDKVRHKKYLNLLSQEAYGWEKYQMSFNS